MKPEFKTSSFKPPTAAQWRKIVATMKNGFPLDFPVSVRRSVKQPPGCEPDWVACTWCDYSDDGAIERAYVWVHAELSRCNATESLQHEWSHLMCEEERPDPEAEYPHDDRFWITLGKIYRAWQRTT